jgi:hypothetical protein
MVFIKWQQLLYTVGSLIAMYHIPVVFYIKPTSADSDLYMHATNETIMPQSAKHFFTLDRLAANKRNQS